MIHARTARSINRIALEIDAAAPFLALGTPISVDSLNNEPILTNLFYSQLMDQGGLPVITEALKNEADPEARGKVLYCVSGESYRHRRTYGVSDEVISVGLVKKNGKARAQFVELGGLAALASLLQGDDLALQRKTAFLVKNLVIEDDSLLPKLQDLGVLSALESIVHGSSDPELVEKLLGLATVILRRSPGSIAPEQKARLLDGLPDIRRRVTGDEKGQIMDDEEMEELVGLLQA